jgi:hypothetical protein
MNPMALPFHLPHQEGDREFLSVRRHAALLNPMGMGKSRPVVEALDQIGARLVPGLGRP